MLTCRGLGAFIPVLLRVLSTRRRPPRWALSTELCDLAWEVYSTISQVSCPLPRPALPSVGGATGGEPQGPVAGASPEAATTSSKLQIVNIFPLLFSLSTKVTVYRSVIFLFVNSQLVC